MAKNLKIILLEDVENLGHVGQSVAVKPGFGRNYLIPQGKALVSSRENLALMSAQRKIYEAAALQTRNEATAMAGRINGLSIEIARKVGEQDTLYGSVTTADVAEALEAKGVVVDKRRILLAEPIKRLGDFKVPVRLHADVTAEVVLAVVAER